MNDTAIIDFTGRDTVTDPLIDFLRKGARELLQVAVKAERDAFLGQFAARRTSDGRAAVVRSGYLPERAVQTGIGPVTVKAPKVRAEDGKPVTFRSALVPPYVRKAKSIEAAEYEDWRKADLGRDEWVYVWADGIYSGLRGDRRPALRIGRHRRQRPGRKAFSRHRRRRARKHPELERGASWPQGPQPHRPETGHQ